MALPNNFYRGKENVFSRASAEEIAATKKQQGFCVRIHDRGLTQGNRIYPITVSWWQKKLI